MARVTNFKQELVGVLGYPVAENPTQVMVEAAFRAMGLDWRYLTVEVQPEALGDAVRGIRAMGWRGFNCTIPHKVAIIRYLDRLSPAAEMIGAVNCVFHDGGMLFGDNTDGKGFTQSVSELAPVQGMHVVLLGGGGAARAIAIELGLAGAASVRIVNRTLERAEAIAAGVSRHTGVLAVPKQWTARYPIPAGTSLVVNATPIALYPDIMAEVPIDYETLTPGMIICDVIPNPPMTPFLRRAHDAGCTILDGLGMLVNQGVIGIKLWTGANADPKVMRAALEAVFSVD